MAIDINELMQRNYKMVIEADPCEGGYVVSFPDLKGCLTCADDFSEIQSVAEDAKRAWFESKIEMGQSIPLPSTTEDYSGQFKIRMPRALHRDLADAAREQGTSMNQYCVYLLAKRNEDERLLALNR